MSMAMKHRTRTVATSQRGFALLMVMFLTTLVLLVAIAAAPYVRTERRREKEEEILEVVYSALCILGGEPWKVKLRMHLSR